VAVRGATWRPVYVSCPTLSGHCAHTRTSIGARGRAQGTVAGAEVEGKGRKGVRIRMESCPRLPEGARAIALSAPLCWRTMRVNPVINLLLKGRVPRRMPSRSRSKSSTRSGTDAKKKSRSRSPAAKGHKSRSRSPAKDTKDKEVPRKRDETPPNVKAARLTVQNLTRNVGGEHLKEIFGTFG